MSQTIRPTVLDRGVRETKRTIINLFFLGAALLILQSSANATNYTASLRDPVGYTSSGLRGISTSGLVGVVYGSTTGGYNHAALWTGDTSVVDLHPAGFESSYAEDVDGTSQVGVALRPGGFVSDERAMLWSGTAASATPLHPAGCSYSHAMGISGAMQVGYAAFSSEHALLWNGSAT